MLVGFHNTVTRSFIITAFDPDQLDGRPEDQVMIGAGNEGASITLSSDELQVTQQLISKCYSYCCVSVFLLLLLNVL